MAAVLFCRDRVMIIAPRHLSRAAGSSPCSIPMARFHRLVVKISAWGQDLENAFDPAKAMTTSKWSFVDFAKVRKAHMIDACRRFRNGQKQPLHFQ